jgi:hypothetical protein
MYEIILYGKDVPRRQARTQKKALEAAREMIDEVGDRTVRKDLFIAKDGMYDGPLTAQAQRGTHRAKKPKEG